MKRIVGWLDAGQRPLHAAAASAAQNLLRRTRVNLAAMKATAPALPELRQGILKAWARNRVEASRFSEDYIFRGLRAAILEILDIEASYGELHN